jgi:hypothetical protein
MFCGQHMAAPARLQFLTVDPSHFPDYPLCRCYTVHLVGLRRSLVRK